MKDQKYKKYKVVWLCHFSNAEIQQLISPHKKVSEYAPWIKSLIHLFKNEDRIELHVVFQHEYLTFSKNIIDQGIHYHAVRKGMPFLGRHWPRFFKWDRWTNYSFWKRKSKRIIQKINPDLIHLHGFENEFCSTILQFKEQYPVFITIQGFISQSKDDSKIINLRKANELKIIQAFNHFGIRTKTMEKDILALKPSAKTYWHQYPMKIPIANSNEKIFDVVFFARITKEKGIEDLLKAVKIIVDQYNSDISVCVIGGGNYSMYEQLAKTLDMDKNVEWKGFLPTQQDVHNMVVQAKISVLPTYHDIVSGTIIESLFLKVPVVAYDTGSIHEVNEHESIIALVEKYNIQELAETIKSLLEVDDESLKLLAEKGYKRVFEMFGETDEQIKQKVIAIYNDVIAQKGN